MDENNNNQVKSLNQLLEALRNLNWTEEQIGEFVSKVLLFVNDSVSKDLLENMSDEEMSRFEEESRDLTDEEIGELTNEVFKLKFDGLSMLEATKLRMEVFIESFLAKLQDGVDPNSLLDNPNPE